MKPPKEHNNSGAIDTKEKAASELPKKEFKVMI
jgi:hypothetical protein